MATDALIPQSPAPVSLLSYMQKGLHTRKDCPGSSGWTEWNQAGTKNQNLVSLVELRMLLRKHYSNTCTFVGFEDEEEGCKPGKESSSPPTVTRKECSPAYTLILAQEDPCQMSDLTNCKLINVVGGHSAHWNSFQKQEETNTPLANSHHAHLASLRDKDMWKKCSLLVLRTSSPLSGYTRITPAQCAEKEAPESHKDNSAQLWTS